MDRSLPRANIGFWHDAEILSSTFTATKLPFGIFAQVIYSGCR
jgi:hypothetical protein